MSPCSSGLRRLSRARHAASYSTGVQPPFAHSLTGVVWGAVAHGESRSRIHAALSSSIATSSRCGAAKTTADPHCRGQMVYPIHRRNAAGRAHSNRPSPPLRPVVTDDDVFLRCATRDEIETDSLPHRVVWGMVYSPTSGTWLVQRRRFDKDVCPGQWDMSCAGHVDCVAGEPESYAEAYHRELLEELGLESELESLEGLCARFSLRSQACVPTAEIGRSREYHRLPTPDGSERLEREHVRMYLSLYDGPVSLDPFGEPQAIAWMARERIASELVDCGRGTPGLALMIDRCWRALNGRV